MRKLLALDTALVFLGDAVMFYGALWSALFLRYLEAPSAELFLLHVTPFSLVFLTWFIVFYIASLYEPHIVILKSRIPSVLLHVQAINSLIAMGFFYFIPAFGITPKTILFIDLILSFFFVTMWRLFGVQILGIRRKERAILVGGGEETRRLFRVVNESAIYPMKFLNWVDIEKLDGIDLEGEVILRARGEGVTTIVIDLKHRDVGSISPKLYELIFSRVRFVDQSKIYEDIFDAIPLSLIGYDWFLENVSSRAHFGYDILKRAMDVLLAIILFIPYLVILPFVALAIKISDSGPIFFLQERVGRGGASIFLIKFRTMSQETKREDRHVTPLGNFLRASRIDELPQLWNVLRGDLSLVGPRPEIPDLVAHYREKIPYYNMRHLITPGLSGWAQVHHENHPHHHADVSETKAKLSYDLYYLKNRSFVLDVKIALKTVKTLLGREGR